MECVVAARVCAIKKLSGRLDADIKEPAAEEACLWNFHVQVFLKASDFSSKRSICWDKFVMFGG